MKQAFYCRLDGKTNHFFLPTELMKKTRKDPPQTGTQKEESELWLPDVNYVDLMESFELDLMDDLNRKGGYES